MLINRKHFSTRSRWIVFNNRRGGPAFPAAGAAYGESSEGKSPQSEYPAGVCSTHRGRNSGSGNRPGFGGSGRDQEGIPLHGRRQRQCFRGNSVRGDFGETWERQSGRGDE